MSAHVEPCYHGGAFTAHEYARGCPGHPHNGLIPIIAHWLDRLEAGDPEAIAGLNRLLGPDPESDARPLVSDAERAAICREIEEGQRVRARGAARGGNYLIGGATHPPEADQ